MKGYSFSKRARDKRDLMSDLSLKSLEMMINQYVISLVDGQGVLDDTLHRYLANMLATGTRKYLFNDDTMGGTIRYDKMTIDLGDIPSKVTGPIDVRNHTMKYQGRIPVTLFDISLSIPMYAVTDTSKGYHGYYEVWRDHASNMQRLYNYIWNEVHRQHPTP